MARIGREHIGDTLCRGNEDLPSHKVPGTFLTALVQVRFKKRLELNLNQRWLIGSRMHEEFFSLELRRCQSFRQLIRAVFYPLAQCI